jgi:hypothetical protein
MKRYLFGLQEADGRVIAYVLIHGDDAAAPVDDNGRSISYGLPIPCRRQWRLKTAETVRRYVRITYIAAPMNPEVVSKPRAFLVSSQSGSKVTADFAGLGPASRSAGSSENGLSPRTSSAPRTRDTQTGVRA